MAQMVKWPAADGLSWMDSGEGGLYAMLVVRSDARADNPHCHIDVSIMMSSPDVLVGPREALKLWAPYDGTSFQKRLGIESHLHEIGREEWRTWVIQAWDGRDLSDAVQAAVHIGSTSASLLSVNGVGFQAQYSHLTDQGKTLYDTLRETYGREPEILTFLDT